MDNILFRKLDETEEKEFRQWVRDTYTPGNKINETWHPVVRSECEKMNIEEIQRRET